MLTLHVYEQNARAVRFYRAAGFSVRSAGVDDATGAQEYEMVWPA